MQPDDNYSLSLDQENLQPRQEKESLFVNIEARQIEYFDEPVLAIFIRNVSKEVDNFTLTKTNEDNKAKLKTMRYSNENVAHEMRTPLSSIIILINLLLALGFTPKE